MMRFGLHMKLLMCKPNLIIYLDVKPERSLERIAQRGRGMESGITLEYLRSLYENYQVFIEDISRVTPVVCIDYDRYATAEEMVEMLRRDYFGASFLRKVTRFDPTR